MVELKKMNFKSEVLSTVTREKNVFAYVQKVRNHLSRAYDVLVIKIPNIKDRIKFATDNKSIEIDLTVINEIQDVYNSATGKDKSLVSKALHSLDNSLNGSVNKTNIF